MNRPRIVLVAITLLASLGMRVSGQAQTPTPSPAHSRSEGILDGWNDIGNKLIAMSQDFPEEQIRLQVAERRAYLCP